MNRELLLSHAWSAPVLAAVAAVLATLVAHRILSLLLLRLTRGLPGVHGMVEQGRPPARWLLPMIAAELVWQAAPNDLPGINAVRHLTGLLVIIFGTWLAARAIRGFTQGFLDAHPANVTDNLQARRIHTQARVLSRIAMSAAVVIGLAMALMTFPGARQAGASLLASAGVFGLVVGLAAKPMFGNLVAGLQLALAQPIRLDDVLVVEGEWGRVEEITGSFVVVRIWDDRSLILPLSYFIEKPFQNWTRSSSQLLGSVFFYVDFSMPIAPLRAELERVVRAAPEWDGRTFGLQVTDTTERTMQLRVLATAVDSGKAFDLRCRIREALIDFMQREYPASLPQLRIARDGEPPPGAATAAG
ncbi:mechanosensitive ion channel family protein [Variovorax sp.]|uniref:mechanosensitive ion channel family protein n=1 Tax=Variovorax sp. TaxID=1871043 RepID=UPI002D57F811|nr:mechanosensitive ion channel domain-containing protein [Variovorax sp.]HYP83969.1 mechanosensitive ion channel domain-containing protein [Variovorax sp.]